VPEAETEEEEEEGQEEIKTPELAKQILMLCIIASALDSGGDEGTRMARGTIMTALFPEWSTVERQNYLLIAMIGIMILCAVILENMKRCLSLPSIAVIGCCATLGTQLLLMLELEVGAFIAVWHCGKLFGFLSTFAAGYIIQETAPKQLLGYWTGRNDMFSNLSQAITPLIFASVYDGFGNVRGQEMLAITACISFLAVLAYAPLIKMMPPPPKKAEHELEELEHYEKLSDTEWCQLPLEVVDKVTEQWLAADKTPRVVTWGNYHEERPVLGQLHDRATKDFQYINDNMLRMLSNRELMKQEQANFKKYENLLPTVDRDKAKELMGSWMADYLDDAGYGNWETQCQVYKAMFMTAFPPIDPLDEAKPDYGNMPIADFEDNVTKFLSVMDNHLAAEQRRLKPKLSLRSLTTLVKRR